MNALTIPGGAAATMTSREIAELTGKEHKNVIRDIRTMLDELGKDGSELSHPQEDKDSRGYTSCFYLNRELTETLLTGYSASARLKVIRRWHDLEEQARNPIAALSRIDLLKLALDSEEQRIKLEAKLDVMAPKVAALDRIETADGMLNLQAAGKTLQQQPNKFVQWLRENGWIYKRPGSAQNCARAEKFNAGYLTTKAHTVIQPDGTERVREQVIVTPKGLAKLAMLFSGKSPANDLFEAKAA